MKTDKYTLICSDRYQFDKICNSDKGWIVLLSGQDSSFYGCWINPITKESISYCEGDVCHKKEMTELEFVNEVRKIHHFHVTNTGNSEMGSRNLFIIKTMTNLGLDDLMS